MTDDRDNDGTPERPGSDDSIPELTPDSGDAGDLEELVPDPPAEPTGVGGVDPAPAPPSAAAPAETSDLRRQVESKDAQLEKVMTAYRALKKETERLRKRIETHQKRRFEQSKNDFIGQFVEVLDNLDRAIDSIEGNFDSDAVLEGIILVRSRLVQLLREEGLEKIFVGGQAFDPTHSEAAGIETVDDPSQDNMVLKELQRGYMLKGGLLRPARVIVGRYSHAAGEDETTGDDRSPTEDGPAAPDDQEPNS